MALSNSTRSKHRPDYILSVLVILLVGIGMIMLYSTGSVVSYNLTGGVSDKNNFFQSQLLSLSLGIGGWYVASKINYQQWRKYAPWLFYISLIVMLLVVVPVFALKANGATRWLRLGVFSFQPVEFFKLSLILYLASWFEKNRHHVTSLSSGLIPFTIILAVIAALVIFIQKDLGSAMVTIGIAMSMYLIAGVPIWIYGISIGALAAGMFASVVLFPYRVSRLMSFINHQSDPSGSTYHINQALIAIGSGGVAGRGLGKSYQVYGYLPEATSDSIFAIIGEQFGFMGTFIIVLLFSIVVYRGYKISRFAPDSFAKSVAVGITVWIGLQAMINIAAMLNLIPLTGIPLPFISYGGTSLLFSLIAVGILQNISRYTVNEEINANNRIRRGDSGTLVADSSSRRKVTRA